MVRHKRGRGYRSIYHNARPYNTRWCKYPPDNILTTYRRRFVQQRVGRASKGGTYTPPFLCCQGTVHRSIGYAQIVSISVERKVNKELIGHDKPIDDEEDQDLVNHLSQDPEMENLHLYVNNSD